MKKGRTTQQMLDAPSGAVYLWHNYDLHYPRKLAKSIGRDDLVIKGLSWLTPQNVRATKPCHVVVDHYAASRLSMDHLDTLYLIRYRIQNY